MIEDHLLLVLMRLYVYVIMCCSN